MITEALHHVFYHKPPEGGDCVVENHYYGGGGIHVHATSVNEAASKAAGAFNIQEGSGLSPDPSLRTTVFWGVDENGNQGYLVR